MQIYIYPSFTLSATAPSAFIQADSEVLFKITSIFPCTFFNLDWGRNKNYLQLQVFLLVTIIIIIIRAFEIFIKVIISFSKESLGTYIGVKLHA